MLFPVSSACSNCGSTLRVYNKVTLETHCHQCGKKQGHPNNLAVILNERQYQKLKNVTFEEGNPCPVCKLPGELVFANGSRICLYCNTPKETP